MPQAVKTDRRPRAEKTIDERTVLSSKRKSEYGEEKCERPHKLAKDGYPACSPLELEEGAARRAHLAQPFDDALYDAWVLLTMRLDRHYGRVRMEAKPVRCEFCAVVRFGRGHDVACGNPACGRVPTPFAALYPPPPAREEEPEDADAQRCLPL